jgi:hypothetical protein
MQKLAEKKESKKESNKMEKQEFDYQTLDQALEAAGGKVDIREIYSTDPEGFGAETKRVMQEVYSSAASLRDVYVRVAIAHAEEIAATILAARELEQTGDFNNTEFDMGYIKCIAGCMEGKKSTIRNRVILGEKAEEIAAAVMQDLGLTLDEVEKLSKRYDEFEARIEDQLKRLGWTTDPCPTLSYLTSLEWEPGKRVLPYLEGAERLGRDREWFEKTQMERGDYCSVAGIVEGINRSPLRDDVKRDAIAAVRVNSEWFDLLFEHGKCKAPEQNYEGVVVWHGSGSVMETLTPVFKKHDVAPTHGRDALRHVYRAVGGRGPLEFEVQESDDES